MPIHDWTRLAAGDFHHFHQGWIVGITNALNGGLLPSPYIAMTEQVTGRPIPDVVTLETSMPESDSGGVAIAAAPPSTRLVQKMERINYARRADRIAIRHARGRVVAIIEIVSPGNKESRNALRTFVEKAADILNQGVHLLVMDLFPPTPRDPRGIHKAIWDEFIDEPYQAPPGKDRAAISYQAGEDPTAYVQEFGVGDALPSMPVFLSQTHYVPVPLEETYLQTWIAFPNVLKRLMEPMA
jgi:hypothetical protein